MNRAMLTTSFTFKVGDAAYRMTNTYDKSNNADYVKVLFDDSGKQLGTFQPEDDHVRAERADGEVKLFHDASKIAMQVAARDWLLSFEDR